uniref:Uncharacterized protein n=1 Tax=Salix viminalis TaxID=40686 RepID=A0A6N2KK81_SALVM
MASLQEPWLLENGNLKGSSKEMRHGRTAHNMSSSSLRKKSDLTLVSKVKYGMLRHLLANLQEVILGTKLSVLLPAIPLAIAAQSYGFGRPWIFALSLLGLTPLAERVSFLTEQIAYYTGPTDFKPETFKLISQVSTAGMSPRENFKRGRICRMFFHPFPAAYLHRPFCSPTNNSLLLNFSFWWEGY